MTIRLSTILLTFAAAIAVTSCTTRLPSPELLPLDKVECARCRMLISAERGSAQIVSATEDTRFYDDVGCLAADWPAHSNRARAFVRVAGGWAEASTASFARPANARTPMGSGVVAFASAAEARAAGAADAPMTFDEIAKLGGARQ